MIGKLTGRIEAIESGYCLIDVQGVGYIVHAHSRDLTRMGMVGESAAFWIEMQVREDALSLYGFLDRSEQIWFQMLTNVQGVGAKAALSILQVCPPDQLHMALASQDKASLTKADGVGPKLATRIVTELKDKAAKMGESVAIISSGSSSQGANSQNSKTAPQMQNNEDAISALVNFGYSRSDAYGAVKKVLDSRANDNEEALPDLQSLIKLALKELNAS